MTWINLKPRQQLEAMKRKYPAIYRAFDLDCVLDALEQETRYTMTEALCEFFRTPEPSSTETEKTR